MTDDPKLKSTPLLDAWRNLWKKKPTPLPAPTPDQPQPAGIPWLRIGLILRAIPFKELKPVFFTVPALLFLAISGLIAWIVVVLRFAVNIFDALV
ncbi:MAG: hypothetical protein EBZ69_01065 [Alphaproteobacteria bacterium]|nr:hypothetical protein [Alphaproteobacteria bacterium]NDG04752.1 hypothetical protein [Alphaproteobacteria bacterium]